MGQQYQVDKVLHLEDNFQAEQDNQEEEGLQVEEERLLGMVRVERHLDMQVVPEGILERVEEVLLEGSQLVAVEHTQEVVELEIPELVDSHEEGILQERQGEEEVLP